MEENVDIVRKTPMPIYSQGEFCEKVLPLIEEDLKEKNLNVNSLKTGDYFLSKRTIMKMKTMRRLHKNGIEDIGEVGKSTISKLKDYFGWEKTENKIYVEF